MQFSGDDIILMPFKRV